MEENEKKDGNDRKAAAFAALCAATVAILALCWFLLHISRYESIYEVLWFIVVFIYAIPIVIFFIMYKVERNILKY